MYSITCKNLVVSHPSALSFTTCPDWRKGAAVGRRQEGDNRRETPAVYCLIQRAKGEGGNLTQFFLMKCRHFVLEVSSKRRCASAVRESNVVWTSVWSINFHFQLIIFIWQSVGKFKHRKRRKSKKGSPSKHFACLSQAEDKNSNSDDLLHRERGEGTPHRPTDDRWKDMTSIPSFVFSSKEKQSGLSPWLLSSSKTPPRKVRFFQWDATQ